MNKNETSKNEKSDKKDEAPLNVISFFIFSNSSFNYSKKNLLA